MRSQLAALPFWGRLSAEEQNAALACAQIKNYAKGSLIYGNDQACLGFIRVLQGAVRVFMLSEEGREILLYRVESGDMDVLSASCVMKAITFETQMVAESDTRLLIVPAACLAGFKQDNVHVRCFIFEKLGERFSDVMREMQSILFTRVDRRIAAALLQKRQQLQSPVLPLTHEQIAREINSSREVVSRTLKEMERQGQISLGRGRIRLQDAEALQEMAAGNFSAYRP